MIIKIIYNLKYTILTIIAVLIFSTLQNLMEICFTNCIIVAIAIIILGTIIIEKKVD